MNPESSEKFVLSVSCPETNGIVRAVSDFLYQQGASIYEAAQHRDPLIDQFFMRIEFESAAQPSPGLEELGQAFQPIVHEFSMQADFFSLAYRPRLLLAVSKHSHCLNDVLHRWASDMLPAEIVGVVSNHEDLRAMVEWHDIPFHFLPIRDGKKQEQEQAILRIVEQHKVDVMALARYMQILSADLCAVMPNRIINIHHSFLPGFKGADPYRQAYNRGVKIIGATAHYVTADLDEGPIIEQAVEKVDHNCGIEELRQIGRDAESVAFARALKWHCEHRVIVNGNKTIVFR